MSGRDRLWATRRPNIDGLPSQERRLLRAVDRLDLPDAQRDVLRALCEMANGAGFCWPLVETLERETGYSKASVYRALKALGALVERYPYRRDPAQERRRKPHLEQQATVGQGPSIYRIGASLRAAAGLIEVDVAETLGLRVAPGEAADETPGIEGMRPPDETPGIDTRSEAAMRPPDETPEIPAIPLQSRASHEFSDETPQRRTENLSGNGSLRQLQTSGPEDDDSTDRLLTALPDLTSAKPSSPFLPPTSDNGHEDEPTLDEALLDPALFETYIAPYASLVEDEEVAG